MDILVGRPEDAGFDLFNNGGGARSGGVEVAVGKSLPAFDAALLECLSEIEIGDGGPLAAGFVFGEHVEWEL